MNRRDAIKQTALLMGYAVSASAVAGVMSGCEATGDPDWTPVFLSPEQGELVAEITECILPTTDTLGAKDVFVHEFIDTMLDKYAKPAEQKGFLAGLTQVEGNAQASYQKAFVDCTPEEQSTVLKEMADAEQTAILAGKIKRGPGVPPPFFSQIKQVTLLGYFTSERVGKEILKFEPIPGRYEGCIPLEEATGGVMWTI